MKKWGLVLFLGAAAFLFAACEGVVQKEDKPSTDWSRSIALGENVTGAIGMTVGDDVGAVHLVWPFGESDGRRIHYTQIDDRGTAAVNRDLPYSGQIRTPHLLNAGDDNLHLVWIGREEGADNWRLWHALLDVNGRPVGQAKPISPAGGTIGRYEAATDLAGGLVVAWDENNQGDLYLTHLDQDGLVVDEPVVINEDGRRPSLQVSEDGSIHLAWLRGQSFWYARLPLSSPGPVEGLEVVIPTHILLGLTGDTLAGPTVALEDEWVYIFFSIHSTTDTQAGGADTEYIVFPADQPAQLAPQKVRMEQAESQPYRPYGGSFGLTELAPPANLSPSNSRLIKDPTVMIGQNADLAVALVVRQDINLEDQYQIATALFSTGQYTGYTIGSKTGRISERPALAVDDNGYLHLAWREGAGGREIYYATTAPAARENLDRIDRSDLITAIPEGLVDSLSSFAFLPVVGLCWLLPGFLLIGAWKVSRDGDSFERRSSWIVLVIGLSVYLIVKLLFLPTMLNYVPFSAWIPIPDGLAPLLQVGIPLAIAAVASLVAFWVNRRSNSALTVYVAFVITDALLSLLVYGVNLLGVF